MQKRKLGRGNLEVSVIGYGCMGLSASGKGVWAPNLFQRSNVDEI